MPAYYPPGFHLALALVPTLLQTTVEAATNVLGFAWLPVLPLSTFLLARHLTGRPEVALLATALTVFGGGYDFSADRLWVNSLFLAGHEAYPLFPRDIVFGLLPIAVYAFIRALEGPASWRWAALAGVLLGLCALVQVQVLLPIPFALATVAVAVGMRRPASRATAFGVLGLTGAIAVLLFAPWLLELVGWIRLNGGVALESSETLLPARIPWWDLPRQFGLFLPFALVGCWAAVVGAYLRPRLAEAPLVLVAWFAIPFVLGFLYDPGWPFEDALRPQRLWLLSSQPAAILAAIGMVVAAERLVAGRLRRPGLVLPVLAAALVVAALPTTFFTAKLLLGTWTQPEYAHLNLVRDHVPDMASILGTSGRRDTVLTYEDWSSLAWYETGSWVVAVKPPGYAKLAFDPEVFTGRSQVQRRLDVGAAFGGTPGALEVVASEYGADRILLARRGEAWGLIHQVAATAPRDGEGTSGTGRVVEGNGWDAVELSPGARLAFPLFQPGSIDLELRFIGIEDGRPAPERAFRLLAVGPADEAQVIGEYRLPATTVDRSQAVAARLDLQPGEQVVVEAVDRVVVQSILGFVTASPPPGWHVAVETDDAVLLERDGT